MRLSRIYVSSDLNVGATIPLSDDRSHYVVRVLRLNVGDAITIFNGQGGEYAAVIDQIMKKTVTVKLSAFEDIDKESPLVIHLGQALSRGEKMDWVIQKAVELGVTEITPLFTERCEVKLSGDRLQKRLEHWRAVATSVCEQCGRNRLPVVHTPQKLPDWCCLVAADLKVLFMPQAGALPSKQPQSVAMLIGPEGGLAESEAALAVKAGFSGVQLGPRVLRTETAPVAAIAVLQNLWGDMSPELSK